MLLKESIVSKPIFEEKDGSKLPEAVLCRVSYPVCNIGEKNANKRVYEKDVWDKVLGDTTLKEMMDQRRLFGHAEHPTESQSDLQLTSHVIHSMWIDEATNVVFQGIDVLDTPMGRIVDSLLRANCLVGVSTRAEGDLEESEDDEGPFSRVLPESYRYITTDFTADPSTFDALPMDVKRGVVSSIATEMKNEKADVGERSFAQKLLESMDCVKYKIKEKGKLSFTPEEQKVVNQIRKEYASLDKRYDFWIGEKEDGSLTWEGGVELSLDKEFRNTYSLLPSGEVIKNMFPNDEKKECFGCGRCAALKETKDSKIPCVKSKPEEYTIASLIAEGRLREGTDVKRGDLTGSLTIKEGMIQIVIDGKAIDLSGVEVASLYPDGTIHVWAKENDIEEPIEVPPPVAEEEMVVEEPVVATDSIEVEDEPEVPMESKDGSKIEESDVMYADNLARMMRRKGKSEAEIKDVLHMSGMTEEEVATTLMTSKDESKANEQDTNVDQQVAKIEELQAKVDAGRGTPEIQAQLEVLKDEVSKAGGEIPEGLGYDSLKERKFNPGDKVQISGGSGIDSDKIVTVVSQNKIKTDGHGTPTNVEGAYKPVDWTKEVAFQYDDGGYGLMFKNRLQHVSEGRIPVEGGYSDKLAAGNLLRKGDNEDWVISEVEANGIYVHPVGAFEKKQLVVWDDLPSYNFVKVSENNELEEEGGRRGYRPQTPEHRVFYDSFYGFLLSHFAGANFSSSDVLRQLQESPQEAEKLRSEHHNLPWAKNPFLMVSTITLTLKKLVKMGYLRNLGLRQSKYFFELVEFKNNELGESVTTIVKEMTDLKIKEAIERAEREVAIETYEALLEKHKSSEMKIKMLVKKTVSERKKAATELANESAKHATGDKEVKTLRSKLEEKAKVAHDAEARIQTMKEGVVVHNQVYEKNIKQLTETTASWSEKKLEEIKEAKEISIEEGKLVGTGIVVNEYVAYKLAELGISVGENTRALLDECMTLREVDDTLEKVTDVMRRSALHSGTVEKIHLGTPPSDPESSKIEKDVEKAFEGM